MILLKTDLIGVLATVLYVLFTAAILITPSVLTFLLYKWLKKRSKLYKILGLSLFILVTVFMSYSAVKLITGESGFEPKYETVEIKQNIGGVLICSSTYSADIHSWDYFIDYKYRFPNDSICHIGDGTFHAVEWKKDEQLIKYNDWIILKTSSDRDADKLFIGRTYFEKWKEYIFSPENIEEYSLWKEQKINSRTDNWDSVSKIENIKSDGTFSVIYQFRKGDNTIFSKVGKRRISFKIDKSTGIPEMLKISNP